MITLINSQNPQGRLIKKVVESLRNGGIIIYPTDTAYGIGCDIFNKKSIEAICQLTTRNKNKPLSFICADLKDISLYAKVTNMAYKIMKKHLPGPYTFILDASRLVPKMIIPKRQTVGIRVPNNNICLAMLKEFGHPIISASVKNEQGDFMSDINEICKKFGHGADFIIDGGEIYPEESSVISLIDDRVEIVRRGKGNTGAFEY
ncbi:MAG: L-threonylcarbamoyladenylate synthase [Deltaproteobacteria bacterium]